MSGDREPSSVDELRALVREVGALVCVPTAYKLAQYASDDRVPSVAEVVAKAYELVDALQLERDRVKP